MPVLAEFLRKTRQDNGGKRYFLCLCSTDFCVSKSRHTMINMSIFHACFKKYITFTVFWCIFGFTKIKQYAVRLPSSLYIFSKFLSRMEIPLWSYHYGHLGLVTYFGVKVTFSSCSISSFNHILTPQNDLVPIDFCSSNSHCFFML